MTEIARFDKTKLKKTETKEKNPLPTKESECPSSLQYAYEALIPPATISLSVIAHHFQVLTKDYMLSKQSSKKKKILNCCSISTSSVHSIPLYVFTTHTPADLNCLLLFSPPATSHRAREERRCHTLTSEHMKKKKLRCHSKKHFLLIITVFQSLTLSSDKGALELPGVP